MKFNKNKALNFAINKSIPLNRFGINEVGWKKEDAVELIESIICEHTLILGGSVYQLNHDTLQPTCESWSCNHQENERRNHYYARSRKTALTYIKGYQDSSETIFILVFSGAFKDLLSLIDNKNPEFLISLKALDGKWCMCPICIDAWECGSEDERVICPKCNNVFSNPLFQKGTETHPREIPQFALAEGEKTRAIVIDKFRWKCPCCDEIFDYKSIEATLICPKCHKYLHKN